MADGLEITFEGIPEFTRMMTDLAGPAAERICAGIAQNGSLVPRIAC